MGFGGNVLIWTCRIFEHFETLQSRSQSQRFQVYQLLNELMLNHRAGMSELVTLCCIQELINVSTP